MLSLVIAGIGAGVWYWYLRVPTSRRSGHAALPVVDKDEGSEDEAVEEVAAPVAEEEEEERRRPRRQGRRDKAAFKSQRGDTSGTNLHGKQLCSGCGRSQAINSCDLD